MVGRPGPCRAPESVRRDRAGPPIPLQLAVRLPAHRWRPSLSPSLCFPFKWRAAVPPAHHGWRVRLRDRRHTAVGLAAHPERAVHQQCPHRPVGPAPGCRPTAPGLGSVAAIKPNLALALLAGARSRTQVVAMGLGAIGLLGVSLLLRPSWPAERLQVIGPPRTSTRWF